MFPKNRLNLGDFILNNSLINKISPENELLLLCAAEKLDKYAKNRLISLMEKNIDWNYVIQKASDHGLIAFLYFHLNSNSAINVPSDVLNKMKEISNKIFQKNLYLSKELLDIIEYLNKNGIIVMPYKGPFLALLVNRNLSFRPFGDLDMLIEKKDIIKISTLLTKIGYKPTITLSPDKEEIYNKYLRDYQFIKKESGIYLEMQWTPIHVSFTFPVNPDFLWKREPMKMNIEGFDIISPQLEELIIILSIHAAGHFWNRILWLFDISELIRKNEVDWDKLMEISTKLNVKRIFFITLYLIRDLFDFKIPKNILKIMQNDKYAQNLSFKIFKYFIDDNYPSGVVPEILFHLKIREKKLDGINDCLKIIFIPSQLELETYKPNKYLNPFIFLLKPMNLLSNKLKH